MSTSIKSSIAGSAKFAVTALSALCLMAAFIPTANASLIVYYNFEDAATGAQPDFTSEAIAFFGVGSANGDRPITTNYSALGMTTAAFGLAPNIALGDPDANDHSMGLSRSALNSPSHFDIDLDTAQGFQSMIVSFALNATGNGFTDVTFLFSTDGGGTFTSAGSSIIISGTPYILSQALPAAADNAPLLDVRIEFTGGGSSGINVTNYVDNIQVNGTINSVTSVPEPATLALLGLGLAGLGFSRRKQ